MSVVLQAVGLGLQVAGNIKAAEATQKASDYQAAVAARNQAIAVENAKRALERGQVEQQEVDLENIVYLGQQMAIQSVSGVTVNSGSAQAARRAAQQLARLDALRVREGARLEAYNYQTQGEAFAAEASFRTMEGKNARRAGFLGAAASLVTGASRIAETVQGRLRGGGGGTTPRFASLIA